MLLCDGPLQKLLGRSQARRVNQVLRGRGGCAIGTNFYWGPCTSPAHCTLDCKQRIASSQSRSDHVDLRTWTPAWLSQTCQKSLGCNCRLSQYPSGPACLELLREHSQARGRTSEQVRRQVRRLAREKLLLVANASGTCSCPR